MNIVIYADEGVSTFSLQETLATFRELLPHATVEPITHPFVALGNWIEQTDLLIIPGGRDIPYDRLLKGKGTDNIRRFVENGGKFLGICAGAYFAAKEVIFEKGTDLEVHEPRDLQFFPGSAVGTLFPTRPFAYGLESGAHAPSIRIEDELIPLYYNGGCYFAEAKTHPVKILGTYADFNDEAAIISCQIGQGIALLSGVHFEVRSSALLRENTPQVVRKTLEQSENKRKNFITKILSHFMTSNCSNDLGC